MADGRFRRLRTLVSSRGIRGALIELAGGKLGQAGQALTRWSGRLGYLGYMRFPDRSRQDVLAANKELTGLLAGRRVFVLATGPSSAKLDLQRLHGEVVIAANESFKQLQRVGVHPFGVAIIDEAYGSEREDYPRLVIELENYARQQNVRIFLNIESRSFFESKGIFAGVRAHYMEFVGDLVELAPIVSELQIDLTRPLPGLYTVSHAAAAIALACGASDVYLVGVDFDYLAAPRQPVRHGYGPSDYNDHDNYSALEIYARELSWDYADMLRHVERQQRCFRILADVAAARGQRLINATPGGLLETLPRVSFNSLWPPVEANR